MRMLQGWRVGGDSKGQILTVGVVDDPQWGCEAVDLGVMAHKTPWMTSVLHPWDQRPWSIWRRSIHAP